MITAYANGDLLIGFMYNNDKLYSENIQFKDYMIKYDSKTEMIQ